MGASRLSGRDVEECYAQQSETNESERGLRVVKHLRSPGALGPLKSPQDQACRSSVSERKCNVRRCVRHPTRPGCSMARRHGTGETLHSARKHLIIKEIKQLSPANWPHDPRFPKQCHSGSRTCCASCIDDCVTQARRCATLRTQGTDERGSAARGTSHERRTDPTRPSPMGQR